MEKWRGNLKRKQECRLALSRNIQQLMSLIIVVYIMIMSKNGKELYERIANGMMKLWKLQEGKMR